MSTQGSRIKEIRTALQLSQEEFGAIFDITKQFVSSMEKDRIYLNNDKLVKLLVDYNVNINYVLAGIGQPFNPPKYEDVKEDILKEVEQMLKDRGL